MGDQNIVYQRFLFNSRSQKPDEDFDIYLATIRQLAAKCRYADLSEELVRDRIVLGIRCEDTRRKLLSDPSLTLSSAIAKCRREEATGRTLKDINGHTDEDVHRPTVKHAQSVRSAKYRSLDGQSEKRGCTYCGRTHAKGREHCPAFGQVCSKCGKRNHFKAVCRQKGRTENTHELQSESESEVIDLVHAMEETAQSKGEKRVYAVMILRDSGRSVKFHIDSGSSTNIIPSAYLPQFIYLFYL